MHRQVEDMDVPPVIVENFPEVQLVQAEKPVLVAYEKVRQSWHALCPVTPANFPRGQDVQTVLGTLENVPVPQEMHEELPCRPVPVEYVPAPQATHTEVPVISEYVPPEQDWHTALADTEHVVDANSPSEQIVQGVQALASDVVEYVAGCRPQTSKSPKFNTWLSPTSCCTVQPKNLYAVVD